jgi:hypothetical protein
LSWSPQHNHKVDHTAYKHLRNKLKKCPELYDLVVTMLHQKYTDREILEKLTEGLTHRDTRARAMHKDPTYFLKLSLNVKDIANARTCLGLSNVRRKRHPKDSLAVMLLYEEERLKHGANGAILYLKLPGEEPTNSWSIRNPISERMKGFKPDVKCNDDLLIVIQTDAQRDVSAPTPHTLFFAVYVCL